MATSLKDIMTDGKKLERMHQYENARHAVIKAYEFAARNFSYQDPIRVYKLDKEGNKVRDYENEVERTADDHHAYMVGHARRIAAELVKDLNETLKVLEETETHGLKTNHS